MKKGKILILGLVIATSLASSVSAAEINKDSSYSDATTVNEKLDFINNNINDKSNLSYENDLKLNNKQQKLFDKIEKLSEKVTGFDDPNFEKLSILKDELYLGGNADFLDDKEDFNPKTRSITDISWIPNWGLYGDILVTSSGKSSNLYVGHAGIADIDEGYTIESWGLGLSPDGGADGVQYRKFYDSYWKKQVKWGRYRPNKTSVSDAYTKVVEYSQSKVGLPYNYTFSVAGPGYYCSELVAFAWKSAGTSLVTNDNAILPSQIAASSQVYRCEGNL